jgi:hypothetical protein
MEYINYVITAGAIERLVFMIFFCVMISSAGYFALSSQIKKLKEYIDENTLFVPDTINGKIKSFIEFDFECHLEKLKSLSDKQEEYDFIKGTKSTLKRANYLASINETAYIDGMIKLIQEIKTHL